MSLNLLTCLMAHDDLSLSVLLLNEGRLADELRAVGLNVHVFDESCHNFVQLAKMIRQFIKEETPDIIHSHRYKENLLAVVASRGLGKVRLVSTQHGLPEVHAAGATLVQSVKSRLNFFVMAHFFGKSVAVSRDIGYHLVRHYGFEEKKVAVVFNGVPMPPVADAKNCEVATPCVGSSGRLFPVKDYPLMVEIARLVVERKKVRFELAGEGPDREEVESLVEKYRLQHSFLLKGHLDDMDGFYRGLDIYLNTSLHEGIPMTILEAMARGIPVIAPDVGGIGEIVDHGVQGFLVQGRDPARFADRCLELLENDELRAAMSLAARKKAMTVFSAQKMAANYYRIYRELSAS